MFNVGDKVYYKHEENNKEYLAEVAMYIPNCFGASRDAYIIFPIEQFDTFNGHRLEVVTSDLIDHYIRQNGAKYDGSMLIRASFSRLIKPEHFRLANGAQQSINVDEERGGLSFM